MKVGIKNPTSPHKSAAPQSDHMVPQLSAIYDHPTEEMVYTVPPNGQAVAFHPNPGASHACISQNTARRCNLTLETSAFPLTELGDQSTVPILAQPQSNFSVIDIKVLISLYVIDMNDEDNELPPVRIGRQWLRRVCPHVYWNEYCIKIKRADGSTVEVLPQSQSTSRTPAKKPTVPTTSYKRLRRLLKHKGTELYALRLQPSSSVGFHTYLATIFDEFSVVFKEDDPYDLPPQREHDFEMNLLQDQPPPVRSVIRLSPNELQLLRITLIELLCKGLICPFSSPFDAPVFFVRKRSAPLRMVCDYRALNSITIPDATPLLLIDEALDQVAVATIFSQIDLVRASHQMQIKTTTLTIDLVGTSHQMSIKDEDSHKTAICTRFGSFEWRVLCFGLCNAPAALSRLIASALRHLNGRCLVLYIDHILFYSKSIEEHKKHLRQVLSPLREHKLYAKLSKCALGVREVDFLVLKVSDQGASTQDRLISSIQYWPIPTLLK